MLCDFHSCHSRVRRLYVERIMAQNHYETIMQSIVSLGIAANIIAKAAPARFKHCIDTAIKVDKVLTQFRDMPDWKKKRFNELFEQKEEDYEVVCGECFNKFDTRACPLCNHINED